MIKCPMCRHLLTDDTRKCTKCQTDLSLLADYVTHLREGLTQAEALTRSGELGEAVWAYLAVLEVDPDNTTARRQVGKVVTAVRQFDETAPGRRWLRTLRKEGKQTADAARDSSGWWSLAALVLLYCGSVVVAYYLGMASAQGGTPEGETDQPVPIERINPERTRPGLGK